MNERSNIMITINSGKIKSYIDINAKNYVKDAINAYYRYINCNNFDDLVCPLCKHRHCLKYHKTYVRNITYLENEQIYDDKIEIAVCVCEHCKKTKAKQKYHALLPDFILPYHIYEASTIISALYDHEKRQRKSKEILERLKITHKLFRDWIKKFKKYLLPSSIITESNNDLSTVLDSIYKLKDIFLDSFYNNYNHPFFLFKLTCVNLCITP